MEHIPSETLDRVVALACRAPSVHNTQPWRWRATAGTLELLTDQARRLMATDRSGRDLVVSCGAALHTACVAAAAEGWAPAVRRLPDPADPGLLARITFRRAEAGDAARTRARVVEQRSTDRRQVSSWPIPPERVQQMSDLARACGVFVTDLSDDDGRAVLDRLMARAAQIQGGQGRYHDELHTWAHGSEDRPEGLGVPPTSRLSQEAVEGLHPALHRFGVGGLEDPRDDASAPQETWLLLSTSSDDTLSWLRTGEALQALWLSCTEQGISLVPHSQPVEVEEVRDRLRVEVLHDTSCPQLVLRLGWAPVSRTPLAATPRREVSEVLHHG